MTIKGRAEGQKKNTSLVLLLNFCIKLQLQPNLPLSFPITWEKNISFIICVKLKVQFSSVQSLSHVWLFVTPWITARQASLPITNSRSLLKPMPSSQWCHPAISSSVIPFSSCPQSRPALGSFPMSQLFAWGGQSIGVSASASVLPMNTQDWFPSGWTGWISLQSKGLSRVFSNTTVESYLQWNILKLLRSISYERWKTYRNWTNNFALLIDNRKDRTLTVCIPTSKKE